METQPSAASEGEGGPSLLHHIPEIEDGATRILDFGCGPGNTLARLRKERNCSELFGIDIRTEYKKELEERLDGHWFLDLGQDEAVLGDEYLGFFNHILLFDVLEHLYDPWYVLPKLAKYLSPSGTMIISIPNLRHWALWYNIILGQFAYGHGGGLMNEEHIRWFTWDTLRELVWLSGMLVVSGRLTFPPNTDVAMMQQRLSAPIAVLELPPPETSSTVQKTVIQFPNISSINNHYPYFLANKLIMVCRRGPKSIEPVHTAVGVLERRRKTDLSS